MRKCEKCSGEMIEDLVLCDTDGPEVSLREKGWFKRSLGRVSAAACPGCGHVEMYLENTERLKEIKYKR